MKPRIKKGNMGWHCGNDPWRGHGASPAEAYRAWERRWFFMMKLNPA